MKTILTMPSPELALLTMTGEGKPFVLNRRTMAELEALLDEVRRRAPRALVLTGEGRFFCAGADIREMAAMDGRELYDWALLGSRLNTNLEELPMPVLAAVNGMALGGGCELAMSCDIILASEKAKFGQPEVGLGITPGFSGTQRLPRRVGIAKAKELIFSGRMIRADEAREIGLVNAVYAPEELLPGALEMARSFVKNAPIAVKYAKACIDRGMQMDMDDAIAVENELFAMCFATHDQKEGMGAFLEKRPAQFTNT